MYGLGLLRCMTCQVIAHACLEVDGDVHTFNIAFARGFFGLLQNSLTFFSRGYLQIFDSHYFITTYLVVEG